MKRQKNVQKNHKITKAVIIENHLQGLCESSSREG